MANVKSSFIDRVEVHMGTEDRIKEGSELVNRTLSDLKRLRPKSYHLKIPWIGEVDLEPNDSERAAAWSLYVELQTRIAIQPFQIESGLLREALNSLYSLFAFTREVLREAGPDVARTPDSFGPIAIKVLTVGIAPFTTRWHQRLLQHEALRPQDRTAFEHERQWKEFDVMVSELRVLQDEMKGYADVLLRIAGLQVEGESPVP
jgi:hypothetical protein